MGNVGKRAAMDEGGCAFQRLYQVGQDGVLEQGGHGAVGIDLLGGNRRLVAGLADHDVGQTALQVFQVGGQTEDRHDFGRYCDIETGLAGETVAGATEADGNVAQRAVIHVHYTAPANAAAVDVEAVAPVHVVVDHRRQQVMCRGNRVEVTGKVQVDVFHRDDLCVAAASRTAFHAEAGAEAWFSQTDCGFLADTTQAITEPDCGGGLAFTGRSRGNRGNEDQFAVLVLLLGLDEAVVNLGFGGAVRKQGSAGNTELCANFGNGSGRGSLGNFNIRQMGHGKVFLVFYCFRGRPAKGGAV